MSDEEYINQPHIQRIIQSKRTILHLIQTLYTKATVVHEEQLSDLIEAEELIKSVAGSLITDSYEYKHR